MDEKTIRTEVAHLFYSVGFVWYHPPDMREKYGTTYEKPNGEEDAPPQETKAQKALGGRIDLIFMHPDGCVLVETKRVDMDDGPRKGHNGSLLFDAISPAQRKNLDRWTFGLGGLAYLGIGTIENNRANKRRLWIIDWKKWVEHEWKMLGLGYKGIPITSSKELGIADVFGVYECLPIKGEVKWQFPDGHTVYEATPVYVHPETEFVRVSYQPVYKGKP